MKSFKRKIILSLLLIAGVSSCSKNTQDSDLALNTINAEEIKTDGTFEVMELPAPPYVQSAVGNRAAKKVVVNLEVIEEVGELANGVEYNFWTFNGTVPGTFIRARVGDEIELHLKNRDDSNFPHNIDLHAVNGPGGGAEATFVAPGKEAVFTFKALHAGLYVYHCAAAPVGMHIANGMYGLILIEPEGGLPPVDKEFYIMQGDFYTKGAFGEKGFQEFDIDKAIAEQPDYVLFNGNTASLLGANELQAKTGETIRLFVGNGGPNLTSSFHAIGEIFDKVYVEGGSLINENIQTTLVPAGGAAMVEFKVDVPGELVLVDHSIFRAFNKGALGILNVTGPENKQIYSGTIQEGIYLPEGGTIQSMPVEDDQPAKEAVEMTKAEKMEMGKKLYGSTCFACHQANGEGIENAFPPLANADYLNEDVDRAIDIVLRGKSGEITVNGKKYNSVMTAQNLTDEEVASVMTYIYNSWGNNGTEVTTEMVKKVRK